MILWIALSLLAILLQSVLSGVVPFLRVKPDLVLLVLMYAAFTRGASRGAALGFAGGVAEDFLSGGQLGVNALVKTLLGFALGALRKKFDYESRGFQFISVFIVSCLNQLAVFFIMRAGPREVSYELLGEVFFPSAFLNAVLGPFAFRLLEKAGKYDKTKPD